MNGKAMVLGIIIFVILIIAGIYFSMMSTINKIKEDQETEFGKSAMFSREELISTSYQLYI